MTGTGPLIKVNRALKSVQWVLTSKKKALVFATIYETLHNFCFSNCHL